MYVWFDRNTAILNIEKSQSVPMKTKHGLPTFPCGLSRSRTSFALVPGGRFPTHMEAYFVVSTGATAK